MKIFGLGLMLILSGVAGGQAPAGAPAGANGICRDGTYSTAASKSGACAGHKGVQTWYAAVAAPAATVAGKPPTAMPAPTAMTGAQAKPAPSATAAPSAPAAMPAASPKVGPAAAAAGKTAAPGGGPGLVWVNTESNVYHCPGTTYYGKTKAGTYMSEADAKAKGAHGVRGASCDKK